MAREPKKLDDLFHDTLKDIYFAEKKILTALPKMAKAAHSEDLRAAFEKHYSETEGQVERLERVFDLIGKKAQGKTCDAIIGLVEEGQGRASRRDIAGRKEHGCDLDEDCGKRRQSGSGVGKSV